MARKPPKYIPPRFYVHYDKKTGEIFSSSVERNLEYASIEITSEEHSRFLSGGEEFSDYQVGYIRTTDNKTILAISPKADQGYAFKNNVFEWITNPPTEDTELTVTWSSSGWQFKLSADGKKRLKEHNEILTFFVMLENDFDFLIHTIIINMQDLVNSKSISKQFNSRLEQDISKISIASKIIFQSYGLQIND